MDLSSTSLSAFLGNPAGYAALSNAEWLDTINNLISIATGVLTREILVAIDAVIDQARGHGMVDAIVSALATIQQDIMDQEGARLWIKVEGQCCKKESCLLFLTRLNWGKHEYWHGCSLGIEDGMGMKSSSDVSKVMGACIAEAINAFDCKRQSNRPDL